MKLNPQAINSINYGKSRAFKLFLDAKDEIPAYKKFLKANSVNPNSVKTPRDFNKLPETNKKNYINAYPMHELLPKGRLDKVSIISSSSGSSGKPQFWPRTEIQDRISARTFEKIYKNIFNTQNVSTLVVNSFGLGSWMAGFEFYGASLYAAQSRDQKVTVVTPGIDKAAAFSFINDLSQYYEQVVISGYPPFVRDIIELGIQNDFEWHKHRIRLLVAGEAYSEAWRKATLKLINEKELSALINVYGMAETGIIGFETPQTIKLRNSTNGQVPRQFQAAPVYQYFPSVRHLEANDKSQILITTNAGIPLIRYNTKDEGQIKTNPAASKQWNLPYIFMRSRPDSAVTIYGVNIYTENIKHALENSKHNKNLTGRFVMSASNLDQGATFQIEIESKSKTVDSSLEKVLLSEIVTALKGVNTEFSKLESSIKSRAWPRIVIKPNGGIGYISGRKHKWVKRD